VFVYPQAGKQTPNDILVAQLFQKVASLGSIPIAKSPILSP
jgi:hypothetical protein